MTKEKIMVVDGDLPTNKTICSCLAKEGFLTLSAYGGEQAMELLKKESPDLIITEALLPDIDGPSLSLEIRRFSNVPVVFLSSKGQDVDKIIGLSAGGDDYMTKPFASGELVARVKAHLRRQHMYLYDSSPKRKSIYEFGNLKIDFDTYECSAYNNSVNLTAKEFDILKLLVENPRQVFSAPQIYEAVWKTNCIESDIKTVMVYISTLRKKIQKNPDDHEFIINVRGVGYKFNDLST